MIKLHLGCGPKIFDGFINIDARKIDERIHVDDVSALATIENNTVDLIYACHVLEHFGRHEYQSVLECWYSKLKTGGVLRLSVPDVKKAMGLYLSGEYYLKQMYGFLWGGQMHEYDYHKIGFDRSILQKSLAAAGFKHKDIKKWDWRQTEHATYDDFSQAYMPHMQKDTGVMMSLNIQAVKR